MPRYIDIDAFRKEHRMNEHCEDCERNSRECQYNDFPMMDFCGWLDDAPTVDAVPVVHGKWEVSDTMLWQNCSICGVSVEVYSMFMCKASEDSNFKYCPHCGAKMDLEGLDDHNGTD